MKENYSWFIQRTMDSSKVFYPFTTDARVYNLENQNVVLEV